MVDPKRHINILSEEDQLFINECEEEFEFRFTEDDAEFQAHCAKEPAPPPLVEPWQSRNFHGSGGGGGRGRFNDRGRHQHRARPYNQNYRGNRYNNNRGRDNRNNRYAPSGDRNY
ncbi:RNA guanine-N7 methyltransferase activating subunit [Toxorhynchites rutilus septentrionalis]|uniref:RNA guanine-N7 methyltransferase activating subunit n=1 Tax=Toxorhynchites rutilus septentrionalis TaxID=329112 RepID=UPI0024786B2F|nr:RNA guanine-N7 methyltransferase activating subunit [Toxorhynchites rutilus septentrionalis]